MQHACTSLPFLSLQVPQDDEIDTKNKTPSLQGLSAWFTSERRPAWAARLMCLVRPFGESAELGLRKLRRDNETSSANRSTRKAARQQNQVNTRFWRDVA